MRKAVLRPILALVVVLCMLLAGTMAVSAENATAYTYVMLSDGSWMRTQDAYLPDNVLMRNELLSQPEDLFVTNGAMYIADSGNSRIVVTELASGMTSYIGEGILQTPTGLWITEDGTVYVADKGLSQIVIFDAQGNVLRTHGRPTEATFGATTQFAPHKIAVGPEGLMYVVSSGSFDGMIQMNAQGQFLGYFGYNNNPTTLADWLIDRFFTEEQKASLLNKIPFSFRNLSMDSRDLVYTVTMTAEGNAVKKHDVGGNNLFPTEMYDEVNFVDTAIGPYGQVYAVTETGIIYEYDTEGNLLFSLGGLAASREMVGLFTKVSAIDCDEQGNLYLLDQERGLAHAFSPTSYADAVHNALDAYNAGRYTECEQLWQSVKRISGSCQMVENGLGNCAFQRHDYETAAQYYKLAENRDGYSDAYWQIRNDQLSQILPYVLVAVLGIMVLLFVYNRFLADKIPYRKPGKYRQNLSMIFGAIRHPIDTFESIRWENKGDCLTATLIYVALFVVFVCNFVLRGFVVSTANTSNTSLLLVALLFVAPVGLFLGCNFLVGEINESKARFRDLYIGFAYCGAPFLVFIPFIVLISHVVTLNESRILELASIAIYIWCFILLIICLKEIHRYLLRTVFANLGITVFLMAVVVLAASLLGMFGDQMYGFFLEIFKEVQLRVS